MHNGGGHWLALLAIGYLAAGAPLSHPLLHGHPGDHEIASGIVIHATVVDAIEHECLLCHYLGQNHIIAFNPPAAVATDVAVGPILGNTPVLYATSPTTPIIPRAPPLRFPPDSLKV